MHKPDLDQIETRAQLVSHLLSAHGGGIEVVPSTREDTVRVRFTGLCTACQLRPLTAAQIIRPAFESLDGVSGVEIEGCRSSSAAEKRLAASMR